MANTCKELELKGNMRCNGQQCQDNLPLFEDKSLEEHENIVICQTCMNDEDEIRYLYHPHCSEEFHKKKKNFGHVFNDIKTVELKNLSEKERILKMIEKNQNTLAVIAGGVAVGGRIVGGLASSAGRIAAKYGASGILNMADELATAGVKVSLNTGTVVGVGAGVSLAVGIIEVGYYAYQWSNGQIDSQAFKVNCIKAAVGNISAGACGIAGTLIGSMVCPVVGSIVGGIIGGLIGAVASYAARKVVDWAYDDGEDEKRAQLILEAMCLLDTPGLNRLNESVVKSCYRRLALTCHPDSTKVINGSDEEKAAASIQWEILKHGKDVLLGFLENSHKFSTRCKGIIVRKYKEEMNKPRAEKLASFVMLQSNMNKAKNSGKKLTFEA